LENRISSRRSGTSKGVFLPDAFYDVTRLPCPKERIVRAFENLIIEEPNDDVLKWLETGVFAFQLSHFQNGVGSEPLYMLGVPSSELKHGKSTKVEDIRKSGADPRGWRARKTVHEKGRIG